jgi:hypothetical protein
MGDVTDRLKLVEAARRSTTWGASTPDTTRRAILPSQSSASAPPWRPTVPEHPWPTAADYLRFARFMPGGPFQILKTDACLATAREALERLREHEPDQHALLTEHIVLPEADRAG